MEITAQHTGSGCLGPLQLFGGSGELNTKHTLICIVRLLRSMKIVCKSADFHQEESRNGLNSRIDF